MLPLSPGLALASVLSVVLPCPSVVVHNVAKPCLAGHVERCSWSAGMEKEKKRVNIHLIVADGPDF